MSKEQINQYINTMQECLNGKMIQYKSELDHTWYDTLNPKWDFSAYLYRVRPAEWYTNLSSQDILCWVWDESKGDTSADLIIEYVFNDKYKFKSKNNSWLNARPFTQEELMTVLLKDNPGL